MSKNKEAFEALERLSCTCYTGYMAEEWSVEWDIYKIRQALKRVQERKPVDVENLKKPNNYLPTSRRDRDLSNHGWNSLLSAIKSQGYEITKPAPASEAQENGAAIRDLAEALENIKQAAVEDMGLYGGAYDMAGLPLLIHAPAIKRAGGEG